MTRRTTVAVVLPSNVDAGNFSLGCAQRDVCETDIKMAKSHARPTVDTQ